MSKLLNFEMNDQEVYMKWSSHAVIAERPPEGLVFCKGFRTLRSICMRISGNELNLKKKTFTD